MKKLLFAIGVTLWMCAPANAQTMSAYTVSSCGGQSLAAGQSFPLTMNLTGDFCVVEKNSAAILAAIQAPIPTATPPYGIIGGVINGADTYNTVTASQTAQALTGGSGGATGDYLSHCTIIPATTAAGAVTIYDNSTAIYSFAGGGTTALTTLIPFSIPIGAVSKYGAWKVTTGANVSVVCVGAFH